VTGEACARCGRVVRLRGRVPEGRICSACCARQRRGRCAACGEDRQLNGRDPIGRPWCERCRRSHRRAVLDAEHRRVVLAAVAALDPDLGDEVIVAVLDDTIRSQRSLRRLAQRLVEHPDVLEAGPTSTLPVLDRFTLALVAAGAQQVRVLHPACVECRRQRPPHSARGRGWVCGACYAQSHVATCAGCANQRRVAARDGRGRPLCSGCRRRPERQAQLDSLAQTIVAQVRTADPSIKRAAIIRVVDTLAPRLTARIALAEAITATPPLSSPHHRDVPVARLLDALAGAGSVLPPASCASCEGPAQPLVTVHGHVRCRPCAKTCPGCGRPAKESDKALCRRCTPDPGRARGTCTDCEQPGRMLDHDRCCRRCRERIAHACQTCGAMTTLTRHLDRWCCHGCVLADELDGVLGPSPDPRLAGLSAALLGAGDPLVTRRWLRRSRGGQLLGDLARQVVPLTHDTFDQLAPDRSVEHLRGLLVAANALEPDHRWFARLEEQLERAASGISQPTDHRIARSWLRWQALPRIRRRAEKGRSTVHSAANLRRQFGHVMAFLGHLHHNGRTLATCRQADIDAWFAQRGAGHHQLRPFLTWSARRRHLANVVVPVRRRSAPSTVTDVEGRWALARRLVHDHSLEPDDRVAGALVVLYAQPVTRIAALTGDDVRCADGHTTLTMDGVELELPEPFATLAVELPRRRRNGVADQLPTPWLFPAARPDRHVTHHALSARLGRLGIRPRQARLAAITQLAAELPPALLAQSIGISPGTAARWAGLAGGNWATYADRSAG